MLARVFILSRITFFSLVVSMCVVFSYAVESGMLFSPEELDKIKNGEILSRMYLKYNGAGENSVEYIDVPVTEYTGVEFKNFEMICDEKAFIPFDVNEKGVQEMYRILTTPSLLKGSLYYSRRDQEVKELIVDAFGVDEKNKKLATESDGIVKIVTKGRFRQKDNKFGTLYFSSELYNSGNDFILVNTCDDAIPFISNKGEYKIVSFFIYDAEAAGYVYYTVYGMRIRTEMFLKKGSIKTLSPTTFSNRLRAATVKLFHLMGNSEEKRYNPWENDPLGRDRYK